jgi:hypothetical protein
MSIHNAKLIITELEDGKLYFRVNYNPKGMDLNQKTHAFALGLYDLGEYLMEGVIKASDLEMFADRLEMKRRLLAKHKQDKAHDEDKEKNKHGESPPNAH